MGNRASSSSRFPRRGGALAAALAAVLLFGPSLPAAAQEAAAAMAVSATPTRVDVQFEDVAGLDRVGAEAGASYSHVEGASLSAPWACVWASRSASGTEPRGGVDVEVRIVQEEYGCRTGFTAYRHDDVTWRAGATGTVPTELWTHTYERDSDGWRFVSSIRESQASATLTLEWEGVGEQRVSPWLVPPSICYAGPPSGPLCFRAGVEVSRDAVVEGSVRFGGLGTTAVLPSGQAGTMRRWAGK